ARAQAARRRAQEKRATAMSTATPSDETDWRELGPVIEEEIHRLPEKYRVPLVLCSLEGKTNEEAARCLGCPKGTVLPRLARGRERLRERLARRGVTLSAAALAALGAGPAPADVPQGAGTSTRNAP